MAHHRREQVACYNGRYHRTIGWYLNGQGRLARKKFYLGTDRASAQVAARRLEQLWECVVAEHEAAIKFTETMSERLIDANSITGEQVAARRDFSHGPHWRAESMMIADAIRNGDPQVAVHPARPDFPTDYLEQLNALRHDYPLVAFVPASPDIYDRARRVLAEDARHQVRQAEDLAEKADMTIPPAEGSPGLYDAIEAFAQDVLDERDAEHNRVEAAAARRLKAAIDDMPLHEFGRSSLDRIARYWKNRPEAKLRGGRSSGRRISLDTVSRQLRVARRFIKWLDQSEAFTWEAPRYAQDALKVDLRRLRTDDEIAAMKDGVAVYSPDELATLYRYGTDLNRLFLLLALNLGGSHAELCSLRTDEVELGEQPPRVRRVRRKSGVYGEFMLWPETVRGLEWYAAIAGKGVGPYVLHTATGKPYTRQQSANAWKRWLDRVEQHVPGFRRLPFKHIRKTAGQMVRRNSDGEIAGVFLCHGKPVASDDLSDVYTNRPFDKVADALEAVRRDLRPVFDAAPKAFETYVDQQKPVEAPTGRRISAPS